MGEISGAGLIKPDPKSPAQRVLELLRATPTLRKVADRYSLVFDFEIEKSFRFTENPGLQPARPDFMFCQSRLAFSL